MSKFNAFCMLFLLALTACIPPQPQEATSQALEPVVTAEVTSQESEQAMTTETTTQSTPDPNPNPPKRQVIIDTDMAVDDWFAILYLLQKPDVDVLAVTVTGTGEAHCDPGVKNALGLVKLADHAPIPTACGVEVPLRGANVFPDSFRDSVDSMLGIHLPKGSNPSSTEDAVDLIAEVLQSNSQPVDILVLGPQTNLAEFVTTYPKLKTRVGKIYLMGGAVNVGGNVASWIEGNAKAEWNIFIDPYAANLVFSSGIPIMMVGLDATNQCPLTMDFYNRIKSNAGTPEAGFVRDVLGQMQSFIESGRWYFWDPMAAAIMLDESLANFEEQPIYVVEEPGKELGATIVFPGAPPIRVAVSADGERFSQDFIQTLNNQ